MRRFLGFLLRLVLVISSIVTGLALEWVAGGRLARARAARETPEKPLRQVLVEDGPAWVRVTLQPVEGGQTIPCAGIPCLWTRREGFRTVVEDLKRDGRWIKHERRRFFRELPRAVYFRLVDGSDTLVMSDWVGVDVGTDLQHTRADELASPALQVREAFLPAGTEAWVCGDFRGGDPRGHIDGKFLLTGLGRERWARDCEGDWRFWLWVGRGLLLVGAVFLWRAMRALLHSSPDQATLPPPADGPNSAKESQNA